MKLLFEINKPEDYPIPVKREISLSDELAQFNALAVGESFLAPNKQGQYRCRLAMRKLHNTTDLKFISRLMTTGRRFWRTA